MKIWKATLVLFYNMADEWESRFDFKLQDKPFDINIYVPDEWIYREGWSIVSIPMNMNVEKIDSGYKVVQGFDHDLSKEELNKLKRTMEERLGNYLYEEKENYIKKYEDKIKAIGLGVACGR